MILMMTTKMRWTINNQNSSLTQLPQLDCLTQLFSKLENLTLPSSEFPCKRAEREDLL
jgi:hypothetical protein